MNLINDEKRIFMWAEENQNQQITDSIFSRIDILSESYYEKRNENDDCIYEYDFSDFMELKRQLVELWKEDYMQKMILISSVATMKGVAAEQNNEKNENRCLNKEMQQDVTIPEYVYVF